MDVRIEKVDKYADKRGDLVVFLRRGNLPVKQFGQIYFVTFKKKGVVRGNHYHKRIREWFGIIDGKLEVELYDTKTKENKRFYLDSSKDKYIRLEIGPRVVHSFKSVTDYASLLNYTDELWSPDDVYEYKIL